MESENLPNGTSNESQSPTVNFILGGEPEILIESVPDEFSKGEKTFRSCLGFIVFSPPLQNSQKYYRKKFTNLTRSINYFSEDDHHDEKSDSFPSGLKPNSFDSLTINPTYGFGVGEQKKRLRLVRITLVIYNPLIELIGRRKLLPRLAGARKKIIF